ncbi:aminobenzoate synthetase [Neisseria arctica]|uniref:Aminobenzoate synthetase n=1 Tax=Neisseria arctica TaxID=1470200 RepID=A0A0J0YTS8_9NEIS|nr:bifunctional anthranilate synthase component I family protein/class IV aminotransferase [Neisseria arctica]KLT73509.1 aminobenzoate synthetase [Neisseria arctica]UOO86178.1 bifunctional anthranilate synthase component I family protein/aminotransferase class IV [Neisseria arctica]
MLHFVLFDDAVANRAKLYRQYCYSRFLTAQDLPQLDPVLQAGWAEGLHAVLWADYEFGLPLMGLDAPAAGNLAVHWFAECNPVENPESWLAEQYQADVPAGISMPQSDTDEADYLRAVAAIQEAIARGDTYQINYTTRLHLKAYGSPFKLYHRLRQPVPYAALAALPSESGETNWTLCFSPELFLNIGSDGLIMTEPMKGTAPVLGDGQDKQRAQALQADEKNRAENVMIVDLLRNDLGKIAVTGGVRVPEPFKVSRFGSVWQMTSAVQAQAKPDIGAADIFQAAFPCGSITGAPKRMSMQIIRSIEAAPRGLYTGSIGWLAPCAGGLGFHGTLNVVIRSLQLKPVSDGLYQGIYGVGSGIVADSVGADEYTECRWKARFLNDLQPEFGVFETLRVENRTCRLLAAHIARLRRSSVALNLPLPDTAAADISAYVGALPDIGVYRVKIVLTRKGLSFEHSPCPPLGQEAQYVLVSDTVLPDNDYLRRFKTTYRGIYDAGWQHAVRQGAFDSLFFNRSGFLLEGGRSSVWVKLNGIWHTPAADLDILDGVMRREVLENTQHYLGCRQVCESRITYSQLQNAEAVMLCNALRGMMEVRLKTD